MEELEAQYPGWDFGVQWTTRASGPDVRQVYAKRTGITLIAFDAVGLQRLLSEHEKSAKSQSEVVHRHRDLGKRVHSFSSPEHLESGP